MANTFDPKCQYSSLPPLTRPLLEWYAVNRREFPWREQATPYRIWVSEIMLQQTRIEAALPYFDRFMAELPTVRALAETSEEKLMKLWEGLGYYSRARNLQKAAQLIMSDYGGELPASYEQLLTLPGIGEYTAGAIASTAFGLPVPAVDGNVLRVMARLLNFDGDVMNTTVKKSLREAVCSMLPPDTPGDFNQAIMELGETVCLPNTVPLCEKCPLTSGCKGRAAGHPEELPVRVAKKARRVEQRTVLVILAGEHVLLHRRETRGLLAGMWELPNADNWISAEQAEKTAAALGALTGAIEVRPLKDGRHIFSHVEWHLKGFRLDVPAFDPPRGDGDNLSEYIWSDARELREKYALPSAFRTYSAHLSEWMKSSIKE